MKLRVIWAIAIPILVVYCVFGFKYLAECSQSYGLATCALKL